ncbi:MAG TPA: tetratricopeptide repeat protein [Candidatus Handelsmanbacteria bacterium]|nr:tetratricopeptide repeat protein [Candidatus Handelsmanbacteria bacterium]
MTSITMANPIAKLEKAFRREPDAPLFARLADLYLDGGQTERALSLCEEGCANFPDYSTGFVVLSKCYEDQGNVEKAREAMDHALRLDPENPGSYKRISDLFQQLGVARLALQTLQQAAYFDPFDDTLNEQIDKLTYTARKDATEDDPAAEVTPLLEVNESPVVATSAEALIAGAPKQDPVNEVVEPFAQVQDLPEWSDSPNVSDALKEFEQGPNPLFTEENAATAAIEPAAPPEIATTEDPGDNIPTTAPAANDSQSDAVAALGFEIFGDKMSEAPDVPPIVDVEETTTDSTTTPPETSVSAMPDAATTNPPPAADVKEESADEITAETEVSPNEKNPVSLFLVPDTEGDEEIEGAPTEAPSDKEAEVDDREEAEANGEKEDKPQVESWISFSDQDKKDKDANPDEVSIFSPEVLPEDSDIFKPQEPPDFSVPATPTEYAPEPEPSTIEETAESSADEPNTKVQEAATETESGVQEVVESPVVATEAEEQEIAESPAAEAEAETPTPFLMSNLTEETPSSSTPPAEAEPASSPTFAPDATANAQDTAENENDSLANLAPETVDEGNSTSSAPFLFGSPSAANAPETTSSEEPEDLSPDDIALPEVAAKADKHFFFSAETSANTAQDETAKDQATTADTPGDPLPESPTSPFLLGTAFSGLKNDPKQPDSAEPFAAGLGPEMEPSREEVPTPRPTSFLSGSAITGSGTGSQDETPAVAEPTEPITESASAEESPAEPTSVADIASFANPAPTEEATTGTSSLFSSSSDTETTEASAASTDAKEPPAPSDDHSAAQNNPELLRLFQEIEQEPEPEPEPEPVFEQPKPHSALKPGHPEDKRIATMTLAEIYTIQGLTQKAIETYRELLEQDPSNTIIRSKLESLEKSSGKQ